MLAVEWGTGQVLWSILWLALFVIWFYLVVVVFSDIVRAREMTGWAKAGWTVLILVLPYLGILIYVLANGSGMAGRKAEEIHREREAARSFVTTTSTGEPAVAADQLERLARLHDSGAIDDAEFARAKAEITGG